MTPKYDETKATQLAAVLLHLRGGRMHYLKLIKLMYLIDREGLLRWGFSITNDKYYSLDKGPLLSRTLDLMTQETLGHAYWKQFISIPLGDWEVQLLKQPEIDELSQAEIELINEIYAKFGPWNRWDLVKYTHTLPEYRDPKGSSLPIDFEDVLLGAGKRPQEIAEVMNDLEEEALFERLIG